MDAVVQNGRRLQAVELILAVLLAVVASGYITRMMPFAVPQALVQIALGAVLAALGIGAVQLDPQVFFLLFLPPLLFLDGWRIPNDVLYRDRRLILNLAFGLVIFTVLGAGSLIHWFIPAIPLPVAFALAAIVSPTDPIAVSAVLSRAALPKRLMHILQGESLLNDASGLVCFRFAVAAALSGAFSLAEAAATLAWTVTVGLAAGVLVVGAIALLQRPLTLKYGESPGSPILLSLLMPFGAYLLAEEAHASGILAAVAAGITMSYVELSGRALAITRMQRAAVWNAVHFALNGAMFVLLGEQLPAILGGAAAAMVEAGARARDPGWLGVYALAIMAALWGLRFAWVWFSMFLSLASSRRHGVSISRPPWRIVGAMTLAGVRGAVTLAGVLSLPRVLPDGSPFPARDLVIFLAAAVILLSLSLSSVLLPFLQKGLSVPHEHDDQRLEDRVRQEAARAAIEAIEGALQGVQQEIQDPDVSAHAASRVIAYYQNRLQSEANWGDVARVKKAESAERALRVAGLRAERAYIFALARHGEISDALSRRLVRNIDLIEARYQ